MEVKRRRAVNKKQIRSDLEGCFFTETLFCITSAVSQMLNVKNVLKKKKN